VRSWTHLERQRGGFGFLGGPGESQIELDRRIIGDRITKITKDLEGVKRTRTIQRGARQKVPYPVVALVGYTNAGKSTLFNALSQATVLAKDMLFATLDPTMRAIILPSGQKIIASDTVGFISHLPTTLVRAFRATLEEVLAADVILHVRDIAHVETEQQKHDVLAVLRDIGIDEEVLENRLIEVWNKSDLLTASAQRALKAKARNTAFCIAVSAQTGEGLSALSEAIEQRCTANWHTLTVNIPHDNGATHAWLHQHGKVLKSHAYKQHTRLTVQLSPQNFQRWESGQENS
jgi:GTP-binding protein HflX